jgi:hypothetical protein
VIESPHRPGRAESGPDGPGAPRRSPASLPRLTCWAAGRTFWVLVVAVWAGFAWSQRPVSYMGAALVSLLAALVLASGALRLSRLIRAGRGDVRMSARLRSSGRRVLADHVLDGQSLEWRVLRWQPRVSGDAHILGPAGPGRWVVVQLPDGRRVWPRTRAQVVVGTAMPKVPEAILNDDGPQAGVHRLLAGYVQAVRCAADLPLIVRRPPGPSTNWWLLGAPRPVIRTLVLLRLRRRLAALANALVHQAMETGSEDGGQVRGRLIEASRDCRALAASLPKLAWLAIGATVATTCLTVLGPLADWSELSKTVSHVPSGHVLKVALFGLAFAVVPLVVLFHSVSCAQALLSPATAIPAWAEAHEATWLRADWDVHQLEADAFASAGAARPRESWRWLRWVTGTIYGLAFGYSVIHWHAWWALAWIAAAVAVYALSKWQRGRVARKRLRAQSGGGPPQPGP